MLDRTNSVAAAEELLKRRSTRRSFAEWAKHKGFVPAAHRVIINEIESFLERDDEVLLLFAPPGSAIVKLGASLGIGLVGALIGGAIFRLKKATNGATS